MYYVTLSFDDGFIKSTLKTAEIFESFGLRSEFNVTANGHLSAPGTFGDFNLWNELQARGHIIQPHGWNHVNKTEVPFEQAQKLINDCLDYFSENLEGFIAEKTVFCFPYNASNKRLEDWVGARVRAFRTGYNRVINPLPTGTTKMIYGDGFPGIRDRIMETLAQFYKQKEGWFVYNTHGLDGEGWEPMTSDFLKQLLESLLKRGDTQILPIIKVFKACGAL